MPDNCLSIYARHKWAQSHLLRLCISVADAKIEAGNFPAADAVDKDGLGTDVAVNKVNAVVQKSETFDKLYKHNSYIP